MATIDFTGAGNDFTLQDAPLATRLAEGEGRDHDFALTEAQQDHLYNLLRGQVKFDADMPREVSHFTGFRLIPVAN